MRVPSQRSSVCQTVARTVAELFAALARRHELTAERVIRSWGRDGEHDLGIYHDAISVLRR